MFMYFFAFFLIMLSHSHIPCVAGLGIFGLRPIVSARASRNMGVGAQPVTAFLFSHVTSCGSAATGCETAPLFWTRRSVNVFVRDYVFENRRETQ